MSDQGSWSTHDPQGSITSTRESYIANSRSYVSFGMVVATHTGPSVPVMQTSIVLTLPASLPSRWGVSVDRVSLVASCKDTGVATPVASGPGFRFDFYFSDADNTSLAPFDAGVALPGFEYATASATGSHTFDAALSLNSDAVAPAVCLYTTYQGFTDVITTIAFVRWHYIPRCG